MFSLKSFGSPKGHSNGHSKRHRSLTSLERHQSVTNTPPEGFPCFLYLSVEVRTTPNKSELWRRDIKNTYPITNE